MTTLPSQLARRPTWRSARRRPTAWRSRRGRHRPPPRCRPRRWPGRGRATARGAVDHLHRPVLRARAERHVGYDVRQPRVQGPGRWRCSTRSSPTGPTAPRHRRGRQRRRGKCRRRVFATPWDRRRRPLTPRRAARRQGRDLDGERARPGRPGVPAAGAAPRSVAAHVQAAVPGVPGRRGVPPPAGQGARPPRPARSRATC